MAHDFKLVNFDTDSIMVCKQNGSPFTEAEREALLVDLNSIFPPGIRWEDDGYYEKVIVVKAKNYLLHDPHAEKPEKRITIKGSALKATTKEKALQEFIRRILDSMVFGKEDPGTIYLEYVREAMNIQDINRWASKKTVSEKVLKSDRTNEVRVRDAIQGAEYSQGDKVYVYFKADGTLQLAERFDGEYDKLRLLKKLHDTSKVFNTVLPKETFPNYSLKRAKATLEELLTNSK